MRRLGVTFCLNYMTYFGRLQRQQTVTATINGEPASIANVLGALLLISGATFLLSLWLANPSNPRN